MSNIILALAGRKVPKCSQYRKPSEISKGKLANGHKKNTSTKTRNHHRKASSSRQLNLKGNVRSDVTYNLNWRHPNHGHPNIDMDPSLHSHGHPRQGTVPWQMEFHSQNLPSQFTGRNFSSSSTMVSPPLARPYAGPYYRNNIHHYPSNPNYNDIPESLDAERQFRELHRTREPFGQRRRSSQ